MFPIKLYKDDIVGLYFHTFHNDGTRNWQGRVVSQSGGEISVQLFSWLTGQPTDIEYIDVDHLHEFVFYQFEGDWLEQGERSFDDPKLINEGKRILSL